ncbi:hypothetical protein [Microbulbifer sp. Q7]|uniref:hypothetical protein n=1 Tax=Microbulbifer sp. Q7 TaxID=1785091 RepID=UPI00082C004B|nr:hypothetical protein [Microbulbifer sp. Q7]
MYATTRRASSKLLLVLSSLLVLPMTVFGAEYNSMFAIDAADLIATAADTIYRERDDIEDNELVATTTMISLSCRSEREVRIPTPSETQCPAPRVVSSPCVATIQYPLRSTIKSDVTTLGDSQCEINFSYEFVSAEQLETGDIIVGMNQGSGSGGMQGDCTTLKPYLEIEEAIHVYQLALERELSAVQP